MNMGMNIEDLAPTMQDQDDAHVGAKPLPPAADFENRLGSRAAEDGIDHAGVVGSQLGEFVGQGHDDVEVFDVEQLIDAVLAPAAAHAGLAAAAVTVPT